MIVSLLKFLSSEAVVTRDSDTHVDGSNDVQHVLNDEEDDSTNIHPFTAAVVIIATIKWRFAIECPERAKNDDNDVKSQ